MLFNGAYRDQYAIDGIRFNRSQGGNPMEKIVWLFLIILMYSNAKSEDNSPRVPQWSKDAVWYQIFPERFDNGNPANDPTPADMIGAWPYKVPEGWKITDWTSDWYQMCDWETNSGQDFYWVTGARRYGGDLEGIIRRLDYLQKLGVTALYLNPIFEAASHHKYDATMYHHIDNNFGPDPDLDKIIWSQEDPAKPETWKWTTADTLFLHLIRACHLRGMKIIIDGVFNHTGTAFWAFQDILQKQEKSPYQNWYTITQWDDPMTPQNEFDYKGWYGIKDLPELREDEQGWIEPVRNHLKAVVKRWMDPDGNGDPSDGIDGWRLDVADMVMLSSWKDFHQWVKTINPQAYITGEVWWQDWSHNGIYNAAPWMQGDCFDGVMNYRFARAAGDWFINKQNRCLTEDFVDSLKNIYRDYHYDHVLAVQNLYDSHDVDRLSSQIVNPDRWFDHLASFKDNKKYDIRKPQPQEWQIFRCMIALQFSLPGAPMIYYGDEAGMWGGDDPDCRKPMVWPELTYDDEKSHPKHLSRPIDPVKFDSTLFAWYQRLISIRKSELSLSRGDIQFLQINNQDNLLAFSRTFNYQTCYIIVNNSSVPHTCSLEQHIFKPLKDVRDLISNQTFPVVDSIIAFPLEPYQVLILK